jgi:HPt (histidine-containing phosphotransfer) domain-containing protein
VSASQKRKGIDLMTTQPTLVFEELLDRIGGDREFAVELLNEWVETLDKEIAELTKAVERKDSEGVRYRAHTLKGAASNLAAREFARLASICEMAAKESNFQEAEATLPKLSYEAETLLSIVPGLG